MFADNLATEFLDTLEVSEIQEDIWGICWFQIIADRKRHIAIFDQIFILFHYNILQMLNLEIIILKMINKQS